jgi:hypothetical protein
MSVVVVNEIEGGTQELYDKVNPRVMPDAKLPDGCELHIAGPYEGGFRVITVWESEDRFQQFRDDTLIPAMQEAGVGERIAPQITTNPVYRLVTD